VKSDVNVRRVWSHDELKVLGEDAGLVQACERELPVEEPVRAAPLPLGEELEARRSSERFSKGLYRYESTYGIHLNNNNASMRGILSCRGLYDVITSSSQ